MIPNIKTDVTVQPDARWTDVALYRDVGYSFACMPPPGFPEEVEAIRELVKLDPRIRALWLTKAIQTVSGGYEKHTFACIGFHSPQGFKGNYPMVENLALPQGGIGAAGLRYENPIFLTSILDGLEQIVMRKGCPANKAEAAATRLRQQGAIGEFVSLASCVEEARRKVWALRRYAEKTDEAKQLQRLALGAIADQKAAEANAARALFKDITYADGDERLQRNPTSFQVGGES
jgi:hypothetical protein